MNATHTSQSVRTFNYSSSLFVILVAMGLNLVVFSWDSRQRGFAQEAARKELNRVQRQYLDTIKPLLKKSCGECHWGEAADAELNFEPYNTLDEILEATNQWKKVIRRVASDEMPPPDEADPLVASEKKELLAWIDRLMNTLDCSDINPGKAILRRLNRIEYQNTIQDLTGVNYRAAESFPGDDVGYGFDNIGEVLSLPPILLEKYYSAAEKILDEAIRSSNDFRLNLRAIDFQHDSSFSHGVQRSGSVLLFTGGTIEKKIKVPKTGKYKLLIHMHGAQAGEDVVRSEVLLDGKSVKQIEVKAKREGQKLYEVALKLRKGTRKIGIRFLNDWYDKELGDRNLWVHEVWVEPAKKRNLENRIVFERPDRLRKNDSQVARKVIRRFASFAYRRALRTTEIDRLMELYDQCRLEGANFDAAIKHTLTAVLVSPNFLYKVELPTGSETRDLSQYELATSLSYFLWSTMPDAELFRLATQGQLSRSEILDAQVVRMLKDSRAKALVENFAGQWLQLRALKDFQPDPDLFPNADKKLLGAMVWETKLTVADVFLKNQSVLRLLNTDSTYVNEALAKHYGIRGVQGRGFQKVSLQGIRPGGILTHGSILTLTSNPTRTSPVKRGKWIMENLLADEPPPPDPDVMQLDDQTELTGTLRQRMEQHRRNPSCAACHRTMDTLGFALENFDAVGRWRTKDEGLEIDASGELESGTRFSGAAGLQKILRTEMRDEFVRCFSEKLLIYALGRGLHYYDQCSLDKIINEAANDDYKFHAFVLAVIQSDPFLKRRGKPQPAKEVNNRSETKNE